MNRTYIDVHAQDTAFRLMLERCAEETIEEERVRRVLEPVLKKIREGQFSRRPVSL
jgi:hypothetical protein